MQAEDELDCLRRFRDGEGVGGYVGYACAWAIREITGEPIPNVEARRVSRMGWFLEPID